MNKPSATVCSHCHSELTTVKRMPAILTQLHVPTAVWTFIVHALVTEVFKNINNSSNNSSQARNAQLVG